MELEKELGKSNPTLSSTKNNPKKDVIIDENELIKIRRERLERLKGLGKNPYLETKFNRSHLASEIINNFEGLEGTEVSVAGRIRTKRGQGKIGFIDLYDSSGKIQIVAKIDNAGEEILKEFHDLYLADLIGVKGTVMKTQRGEISINLKELKLLGVCLQAPPEKRLGLVDTETRYRQRYADMIGNPEIGQLFRKISKITGGMRSFLEERGFVEVETPMMHSIPGGATAKPFTTKHNALGMDLYLRIAPELYLKRLVVGGMEKVFEINRNFRNEGIDTTHNPEFTMIELYEAYTDCQGMMNTVEEMICGLNEKSNGKEIVPYGDLEINFAKPWKRISMKDAVKEKINLDLEGLKLLEAFEEHVEKTLVNPTFITDFPIEVSPLAKRKNDKVADRFELFVAGSELANGFSELNDPDEQKERFLEQVAKKEAGKGEGSEFYDADYITALEYGMPPTAGAGIGNNRLMMLLTNNTSIREVIAFPLLKNKS